MADIEQRRTAQTECAFTVGVALAGGAVGGFVFWLLPQISPATKANVQLSLIAAAKGQWPSLLAGTATGAGVLVALCVAALHVARQRHIESPPLHSSFAFLLLPLISVLWFTPLRTANFQMLIVFVFIVSVAACAARLAALLRIPASLDGQRVCRGVLVLLMVVYFAVFSSLSITKFDRMQCDLYDLGIHDSLTWHATRGRLFTDFRGPYDHFAPIVLTYVPLYFVWPSPKALLALQSLVLALGAWPLYQLARLRLQSALAGIVVATAYLLYPLLSRANLHDFHPELFAAPVFFMACWELWRERVRWFFLWVVVLLCVKEGMAVLVFALGLFILIGMRRRRLGAVVCLLAVVWSVWVLSIYFPLIVGAKFPHYARYGTVLSTDGGLVWGLWQRTAAALGSHFVWRTALLVLVPLGFLPLGSASGFLCLAAIPMAEQFLSDNPPQQLLKAHYSAAIIGGILVATVLGLEAFIRRGERDQRLRFALAFLLTSALLSNYFFGDSPFHRYAHNDAVNYDYGLHGRLLSVSLDWHRYWPGWHERVFHAFRRLVPPDASVMAQYNLACYLMHRERVSPPQRGQEYDFYLWDARMPSPSANVALDAEVQREIASRPDYSPLLAWDGFIFYARGDRWRDIVQAGRDRLARHPDDLPTRFVMARILLQRRLHDKRRDPP